MLDPCDTPPNFIYLIVLNHYFLFQKCLLHRLFVFLICNLSLSLSCPKWLIHHSLSCLCFGRSATMVDHSSEMMLWVPLLLICVFNLGFSEQDDIINIGAVFSFGTINGKVAKIAMASAAHDVNSDPTILPASKIVISMHDSNYSGFLGIIGGNYFSPIYHFSFNLCQNLPLQIKMGWFQNIQYIFWFVVKYIIYTPIVFSL